MEPDRKRPVQVFQPWSCDLCGEYGTVEAQSDWDDGEIIAAAHEQHRFGSTCPGRLRFPASWSTTSSGAA
jgi:hypothetical protein